MNRFHKDKKAFGKKLSLMCSGAVFFLIFFLFWGGIRSVSQTALEEQKKNLRSAILKSAVHCYAVEGRYPESLDYLKEFYGIHYDEEKFLVDYEIIGSNLMPHVTIFLLDNQGGSS